jgi:hypothetical protein
MILGPVDLGEDRLTVTRPSSSADISGNGRHARPSNTRICSYDLDELMAQGPCRRRAGTRPLVAQEVAVAAGLDGGVVNEDVGGG